MKIGIFIRSLTVSGGTERQALALAHELSARGHDVTIGTISYDPVICFPDLVRPLKIISLSGDPDDTHAPRDLVRLLPVDFDLINPHDGYGARIAYWYKKISKKVPSVLMLNDLHIAQWSLFDDPAFGRRRKSIARRVVDRLRDMWGVLPYIRSSDRIAVLDERTRVKLVQYIGRDAIVVPSGLDADAFTFASKQAPGSKKIRILCHGIFYIHRRFEDVINALPILKKAGFEPTLTIIGDYMHKPAATAYCERLVELVRSKELSENVVFRGRVSEEELKAAYHEHDVFVFASHMQTWGLAVFEAMASGIPVVVSNTAGASRVLSDMNNALVVSALSPEAIAGAISTLVSDPKLYDRITRNANDFVRATITWQKYTDRIIELFTETLQSKR